MTPQQTEVLRKKREEIRQGVDQTLSKRTQEQKQQDLDALLKAARDVYERVRKVKGKEANRIET